MDVSALSGPSFSPAEWINANYKKFVEENGRDDSDAASSFIRSYVAKESLQESDGWGNLLAELEDGFERNDLKVRGMLIIYYKLYC